MNEQYDIVAQYAVNYDHEQREAESESYRIVWSGDQAPDETDIAIARTNAFSEPAVRNRVDLDEFSESGTLMLIREQLALRREMQVARTRMIFGIKRTKVIGTILVDPRLESEAS